MGDSSTTEENSDDDHVPPDGLKRTPDAQPSGPDEFVHIGKEAAELSTGALSSRHISDLIDLLLEMIQDAPLAGKNARVLLAEMIELINARHPGCFSRTSCLRLIELVAYFEKQHGK